ncbi:MAG: ThuA domain-containing protein [Propionibacteriaceae bacterium]|nr:ThuA domain-containing protein [Propionibacteriaceae bacterium]
MPAAIILSGTGRYADPWHDFALTSAALETVAREAGWQVSITEDIDATLALGLDGVDLLIVNAGNPGTTPPEDPALIDRGRANLAAAFKRGISVLGAHTAATSLRDYPQYRTVLGGEWVPGHSWHPPFCEIHVRPLHDLIVEGLSDFTVQDERYTDLVLDPGVEPLASTRDEDRRHILAWANEAGPTRVVYSALGHDGRAYESPGYRSFLRRVLIWLLPRPVFHD